MDALFEFGTEFCPFFTRFVPSDECFERFDAIGIDAQDGAFDVDASFEVVESRFIELCEGAIESHARFVIAGLFGACGSQSDGLGKASVVFGIARGGNDGVESVVIFGCQRQDFATQTKCAIDICHVVGVVFGDVSQSVEILRIGGRLFAFDEWQANGGFLSVATLCENGFFDRRHRHCAIGDELFAQCQIGHIERFVDGESFFRDFCSRGGVIGAIPPFAVDVEQ